MGASEEKGNYGYSKSNISNMKKWMISLYSMILFFVIANPMTYRLVNNLLGGLVGKIADGKGCPTMLGLIVHSVVFLLIVRYSM
mgnify:CR=1 FL=1